MKNALAALTAFAAMLLMGALARAAVASRDATPGNAPASAPTHNHAANAPANVEPGTGHKNHVVADNTPEDPPPKETEFAELGNTLDPTSGAPLGAAPLSVQHKGWRIGLADEAGKTRFLKNPIRYYAKLSLEPVTGGNPIKVDGSKYEKALAEICPVMGNEIDPDADVFIFHRGWKVYFC
jgi:hypothetical protein